MTFLLRPDNSRAVICRAPLVLAALFLASIVGVPRLHATEVVISIKNQTMTVMEGRTRKAEFPVSTSKFGLGDNFRSFRTPTGAFTIERKVGDHLPSGAVLKGLNFTGEVLRPDAPGRDPIVTRILHLRGLDNCNAGAFGRGIYIHGTAEEWSIGTPASYGCVRMNNLDIIDLYERVAAGTAVEIQP